MSFKSGKQRKAFFSNFRLANRLPDEISDPDFKFVRSKGKVFIQRTGHLKKGQVRIIKRKA